MDHGFSITTLREGSESSHTESVAMNSPPAVSVIVPLYNSASFVGPCLESLASQAITDVQIVFVDDGSRDHTPAMVSEFVRSHPHMTLLQHKHNSGVHAARITGLAESTGRYIGFVDSDDQVLPETFATMYDAATRSDADIVICGALSGPQRRTLVSLPEAIHTEHLSERFAAMEFGTGSLWNKLYHRPVLTDNPSMQQGACQGIRRSEDYIVNVGAFYLAHRIVTLSTHLYHVTERVGSISRGAAKADKLLDQFRACRIGMSVYRDWHQGVARTVGASFLNRLSYSSYHPDLSQLLRVAPGLAGEVAVIAMQDPRTAWKLTRRLGYILRKSLK
jgi:glycosyltransferase involved in cell wall biosynthesis